MPLNINYQHGGNALHILATGTLTREDYDKWIPEIEDILRVRGKVNMLFEMKDFHGWKVGAAWQDLKFGAKHFRDIERIALLGDKKWQHLMAALCKPFTTAEVRDFTFDEEDEAHRWVGLTPVNAAVQH